MSKLSIMGSLGVFIQAPIITYLGYYFYAPLNKKAILYFDIIFSICLIIALLNFLFKAHKTKDAGNFLIMFIFIFLGQPFSRMLYRLDLMTLRQFDYFMILCFSVVFFWITYCILQEANVGLKIKLPIVLFITSIFVVGMLMAIVFVMEEPPSQICAFLIITILALGLISFILEIFAECKILKKRGINRDRFTITPLALGY